MNWEIHVKCPRCLTEAISKYDGHYSRCDCEEVYVQQLEDGTVDVGSKSYPKLEIYKKEIK